MNGSIPVWLLLAGALTLMPALAEDTVNAGCRIGGIGRNPAGQTAERH